MKPLSEKKCYMPEEMVKAYSRAITPIMFRDEDVAEAVRMLKERIKNCEYDDFDRTFAIDNLNEIFGEFK